MNATRRQAGGFSVIEIMVAVSLLAVIIVGLLAMFYQVQRAFRAGTAQADVMEGGRAVMGVVTRDLQAMSPTFQDFTMNFLTVPAEAPPGNPNLFTVQALPSGAARENFLRDFCFLSRENDEWIATAYRIRNSASGVGTLYRMVERRTNDSNPTINAQIIQQLSFLVSTSRVDHTNYHQVLDGVVHFYADAYTPQGLLSSNQMFFLPGQAQPASYGFTNAVLPGYVDLELAVLEPGVVDSFRARADIDPVRATNYLAKQIGRTHVFRQRIAIKAGNAPN